MIISNVWIYTEEKRFKRGFVRTEGDRIAEIGEQEPVEESFDGAGCYLIPGMIDIHTHGCVGYDFCDGTPEAVERMAKYLAAIGVTTFAPATMTLSVEALERILQTGALFRQEKKQGKYPFHADLAGINMEGPFISKEKKGAQKEAYIIPAATEVFEHFQKTAGGLVKYIGIAPEAYESMGFIRQVRDRARVTLAHSNADYNTAREAFSLGVNHVTHLYNAMSPFHHRDPGIVGAVADCRHVEAELICDGVHVHPAVIRSTFRLLGAERILFVSDSMRATGMPDGVYELGGQQVTVQGSFATLEDGTIAGSVTTLPDCLRYAVREAGIAPEEAISCVTMNPARSLGIYGECGSITVGKRADLVLLGSEYQVRMVIKSGHIL